MRVIYRLTSIPSSNPSPIYQMDKNKLNTLCLRSFVKAFSDVNPKITFLFDHADKEMYKMVEEAVPFDYEIITSSSGQNQTMLDSYKIASTAEDYILFQECDYLYNGVIGKKYLNALRSLGFVSPYNHPNFYLDKNLHSDQCTIKLVDDYHFRSCERNTMTWGAHSNLIKENIDILNKYGYLDGDVWYDLKDKGYLLYVPLPSFATHMVASCLAPGINWEELWNTQ